jgi:5-dehydro-2-deoxygluconokinase
VAISSNQNLELEVITIGRIGVDLYPLQSGVPLEQVTSFGKFLGGSATNVAVAAARLGRKAAVITKVGNDPFGRYAKQALEKFGVWTGWVGIDNQLRTPITFCEIFPPDNFPILFYRQPKAPDLNITLQDFDMELVMRAPLVWTTGVGLSQEPSRSTNLEILKQRSKKNLGFTVHDIDYRPSLWPDLTEAGPLAREAIANATVVVGNTEEVQMAVGSDNPEIAAKRILDLGARLAIVKLGKNGAFALSESGKSVRVEGFPLPIVCGLGAGDAFGGALCHGLLSGWPLDKVLLYADAAGAIVASRLACADAMPTAAEIESVITQYANVR